jgi:hypothetical protein
VGSAVSGRRDRLAETKTGESTALADIAHVVVLMVEFDGLSGTEANEDLDGARHGRRHPRAIMDHGDRGRIAILLDNFNALALAPLSPGFPCRQGKLRVKIFLLKNIQPY